MIRKFKTDDLDAIMEIWLKTNVEAHFFISKSYWLKNYDSVKSMLPDAEIFVYEDNGTIQGFVGLMENYIAGIFVRQECWSHGIGKALLDHVKNRYDELSLHVYQKNMRAVRFYKRESFDVFNKQVDEGTGEIEIVMNWRNQ
ncbi:MAG: N-acetyltransferase [Synergistaceae bacterium]|jgi:putative acetyltransferase|nr:N-acetyltransferase [Synergistaceae bacterium]